MDFFPITWAGGYIGFKKFVVIQVDTGYGLCGEDNYPPAHIPIQYYIFFTLEAHSRGSSHSPSRLSHSPLSLFSHQFMTNEIPHKLRYSVKMEQPTLIIPCGCRTLTLTLTHQSSTTGRHKKGLTIK